MGAGEGDAGAAMARAHREPGRRRLLAVVAALGMAFAGSAPAAQNLALRRALRYQDAPKGGQRCGGCLHFVAGAVTSGDRGACKIMPGDDEVSPNGWCISWVAASM